MEVRIHGSSNTTFDEVTSQNQNLDAVKVKIQ